MKKIVSILLLSTSFANAEYLYVQKNLKIEDYVSSAQGLSLEQLTCGLAHCYALKNGEVWVIGRNDNGQLGLGHRTNQSNWVNTNFQADKVYAGYDHGLAIKNGKLYGTGHNGSSELFRSPTAWCPDGCILSWTDLNTNATDAAAGNRSSYIVQSGNLKSIGVNYNGQLGNNTTGWSSTWQDMNFQPDSIAVGNNNFFAIKDGEVWSTGYNNQGQLGLGHVSDVRTLQNTNQQATKVTPGAEHTYILHNGTIWATGDNQYGQLGINSTTDQNTFQDTGTEASQVIAGDDHGLAINSNGNLIVVGKNNVGQIGNMGSNNRIFNESPLGSVDSVHSSPFADYSHIIKNKIPYGAGYNGYGQLGVGGTNNETSFKESFDFTFE